MGPASFSGAITATGQTVMSGNARIGSNTMSNPLTIIGSNVRIFPSTTTAQGQSTYYIASSSGTGDGSPTYGYFGVSNYGNVVINTEAYSGGNPTAGDVSIIFKNNNSEKMRITNAGNVGIGTTTPSYKLDIPSGTLSTRISTNTTGGILLGDISSNIDNDAIVQIGGTANVHTSLAMYHNAITEQTHIVFVNPLGRVGAIFTSGSTTTFNTSSDYRLKTNIEPMTNIWNQFMQLNPVTFNFKSNLDTQIQGFIAHEVQDIVPLAVTGEKDAVDKDGKEIYQGIDASKLIPLLVAALKDLKKMTDEQASQIATLTAQVNLLLNK